MAATVAWPVYGRALFGAQGRTDQVPIVAKTQRLVSRPRPQLDIKITTYMISGQDQGQVSG